MKKLINHSLVKLGVLFLAALFFQATFAQASEAGEMTPFYKSWLKERSYTHPGLRPKTSTPAATKMAQPKAMASVKASPSKITKTPFYKSWLQERSYAHPGLSSSSAAASTPAKIAVKAGPEKKAKSPAAEYKKRPEFNVCNFVCLSTCKTCSKSSSSNYLMSRE